MNLIHPHTKNMLLVSEHSALSIGSGYAVSGNHKIRCFGSYTAPIVYTAASVRLPSQCREDTPCSVAVRGTIELCGELLQ